MPMYSEPVLSGYQIIEELYSGSRTLVYRAVRQADQQPVVIKLLKNKHPSFNELVQFRNQYVITQNLQILGIVKPDSLEYGNGYALVMEDFGGESLRHFAKDRSLPLEQFLPIALQLVDILHSLHQQHVIHKDIKPANILIQPETQQVKLIDFSISSLLPKETQEIKTLNGLEGTLSYLSPEQTGRMNRGIDYRSDFYSLGVTFYELLTGQLPFQSTDPMELVHCHIAEVPRPVCTLNPTIPSVLSAIVQKLMAKNAEDRYQSALGLKHDLLACMTQWQAGSVSRFELGARDLCDRFLIPEKLYGREQEVQTLLEAFGRVTNGASELMLIAGFSGIGKTAVVNEVHKPIVRWNGYFIKGKYDQFNHNIPLSAFVQALRDLMGQLLSESDLQLRQWRDRILSALGENGQVLIEVIPELEQVIGKQSPAAELSGSAAQNRFNLLLQKFIGVFTTQEHPLVMFLDDLQWADSASLSLMQVLMSQRAASYLFIIGAYRDNEVFPAHPLMLTLNKIAKADAAFNTLTLKPLSQLNVNDLTADTLSCAIDLALPLTELVYQKTQGNPFFTTQFLKTLHQEGYITFDPQVGHWQCDLATVRSLSLTDNVVEFMALQLQKLPAATQSMLKLAACIGVQFDLETLAIVSQRSLEDTATDLWKALQEELILPINEVYKFYQRESSALRTQSLSEAHPHSLLTAQHCSYRFFHDRVQQAAYSLIPDDQKQLTHLQIGQLLQQKLSETEREDKLFDIVRHLNKGQTLLTQLNDQEALARLNLKAGTKARRATAYAAAQSYLQTGIALLQPDCWETQYELSLHLYEATAEASYLKGAFEDVEQLAAVVLQQARSILDQVKTYEIKMLAKTAQSQGIAAIAVTIDALSQLGVEFPTELDEVKLGKALQNLECQLQGRQIQELVDLPVMSNPTSAAALRLLGKSFSPIYIAKPELTPLLSATMVNVSLQFGNAPASTVGYALHSMVLCAFRGEVETGYRFGELALLLVEQFNAQEYKPLVLTLFGNFIRHSREALRATIPILQDGYTAGMETGDFLNAGYSILGYTQHQFFAGIELESCETELASYSDVLAQVKQSSPQTYLNIVWQIVKNLRTTIDQPDRLIGDAYDETVMLTKHQQDNDVGAFAHLYIQKLMLAYLWGNYSNGNNYLSQANQYLFAATGLYLVPLFHFYAALTHLALFPQAPAIEQAEILSAVETHQATLHQWADNAPMNHLHKWHLVEAEKHRVLGNKVAAVEQYDQAIALAKANEYVQEESLANELAAKFYLDWSKERIAQEYMTEAYYGYARWGAKAKIVDLETRYPQLLALILQQKRSGISINGTVFASNTVTSICSSSSVSDALDLAVILKASRSLSSELELGKLLASLLQLILENAGADKCVLLLRDGLQNAIANNRLLVKGLATTGAEPTVLQRIPLEESQDIPLKLVYRVKNCLAPVVLMDANADTEFAADPYFLRQHPKSILCSPILHQGRLLGIVYLENNLTIGAFTNERVHVLNLLCAQASISLEHARLYKQSQDHAQALERSLEKLRASEARFQRMTDNIPGVVYQFQWNLDGSTSTPFISSGCTALFGVSPEDIITGAKDFREMEHPDDRRTIEQVAMQATQTLTPFEQESRIVTASGSVKWIQTVARPERQADGSIVWDGMKIDVTNRKQAEKALKLTQFAIDHASLPAWWVKSNGQILYVNDAACRDLGYSKAEILERYVWDFNPEVSEEGWEEHRKETKDKGSLTFESVHINKSGEIYPVEVAINYIELDGEEYHFTFVKNIRDRRQIEAASRAVQERLTFLIQQTPLAVIEWNLEFKVVGWNPSAEKIFGYRAEEMLNQHAIQIVPEPDRVHVAEVMQGLMCNQSGYYSLNQNICKDGSLITCEWINTPLLNTEGIPIGIFSIVQDVSDRKAAELAIQQKTEALESALQELQQAQLQIIQSEKMSALGNLVAGVAHEINNPVGFIAGNLQPALDYVNDIFGLLDLYQQEYPNPSQVIQHEVEAIDLDYVREDLPKLISSMKLGVDRIRGISTSLRTFSRADKDYKVPFNIHEGIDSTILILKHRLKANELRPEIEVNTNYGNIPVIECFPGQLNQVFMNILANAIDALEEATQKSSFADIKAKPNQIEIQTQLDDSKEQVIIQIRDNGMGMPDEIKQRVFDHLFTTKAVGKGTGLGLAISYQMVEKHSGTISVNSTVGVGTEFVIMLPVKANGSA